MTNSIVVQPLEQVISFLNQPISIAFQAQKILCMDYALFKSEESSRKFMSPVVHACDIMCLRPSSERSILVQYVDDPVCPSGRSETERWSDRLDLTAALTAATSTRPAH